MRKYRDKMIFPDYPYPVQDCRVAETFLRRM